MTSLVSWTEIQNFYEVRRIVLDNPELADNRPVAYGAKVKLHGSCAGIRIDPDGTVTPFSRQCVLDSSNSLKGFANWVWDTRDAWSGLHQTQPLVIFGEWCGPGIQKGVAITSLKERIFAIFAAVTLKDEARDKFIFEPSELEAFRVSERAHVLPWFQKEIYIVDWSAESAILQPTLDRINQQVEAIEVCDPWVKTTFGVEGTGEGLVFYPTSHQGYEYFSNLSFKAKGEQHKVVARTKPVQIEPTVAANAEAYAEMVVTPARLEQGVRAISNGDLIFDIKRTPVFLKWISDDLEKECTSELNASKLEAKIAMQACQTRARIWFVAQTRKL